MSFCNFLHFNLKSLAFSKHKLTRKLLEKMKKYGICTMSMYERSKFLSQFSVSVNDGNIQNFIEHEEEAYRGSVEDLDAITEFDLALAYRRFPSIILGASSAVDLYDDIPCQPDITELSLAEQCKVYLPGSVGANVIEPTKTLDSPSMGTFPSLDGRDTNGLLMLSTSVAASGSEREIDYAYAGNGVRQFSGGTVHKSKELSTSYEFSFDRPISSIPGISARQRLQLENCGFHTMRKLLHHFPRSYADLKNARGVIDDGQYLIFVGKVLSSRGIKAGSSFSFLEVVVGCELFSDEEALGINIDYCGSQEKRTIYLHLKKYFRGTRFTCFPFLRSLESKHREGDLVYVSGKVKAMHKKDHYEMREYIIDMLEEDEVLSPHGEGKPYPLYPSKSGLKPSFLRDIITKVLQTMSTNIDPVPANICEEFQLLGLHDAYMQIHHPKDLNHAELARKRLIFDDFFYLQLGRLFQMLQGLHTQVERDGLLDRYRKHQETYTNAMEGWSVLTKEFLGALEFPLTSSQLNAVSEIIWDLKRPIPMNRLLQGDVGCGKTIVAFLACMEVIGSGFQAAFMVPSELVAIQHYESLLSLLDNVDGLVKSSVALLTGSTSSKQSRLIRKGIQSGEICLVIGTHSLISENVEFSALRIAVIDEQHRFGVIQRGRFNSKLCSISTTEKAEAAGSDESVMDKAYMAPHVLAMSATPIPRSLALALYGDMSLTQITDLPPGRVPVETYTFEGNENGLEKVYQMMEAELQNGGKVYLVYPVIEESEQLPQLRAATAELASVSSRFEGYQCGLLHGRMKFDEKNEALRLFRSGETRILLSTQVIEIGVDIPDASMMVVMNAERFGFAQLHQLRGRVGRGTRKSKCIFLSSTACALNRLKVLEKSSDGFYLANVDLMLRGPGNLLGKKQSGHLPEFPIARLEVDGNLLQEAHLAALKVLGASPDLESFPKLKTELSMRQPLSLLGD